MLVKTKANLNLKTAYSNSIVRGEAFRKKKIVRKCTWASIRGIKLVLTVYSLWVALWDSYKRNIMGLAWNSPEEQSACLYSLEKVSSSSLYLLLISCVNYSPLIFHNFKKKISKSHSPWPTYLLLASDNLPDFKLWKLAGGGGRWRNGSAVNGFLLDVWYTRIVNIHLVSYLGWWWLLAED